MQEGTNDQHAAAPESGWRYQSDQGAPEAPSPAPHPTHRNAHIEWTASEFVAHHKSANWYLMLVFAVLAGGGLIYWFTKDLITVGVIAFCGVIFGIAAARKPRVLGYRLDEAGLTIAQRFYPYADYRAFTVVDEGAFASISFIPLKRFMPAINIYFDPKDEDHIIDALSEYLPLQPSAPTVVDHVMRRLRF